MPDAAARPSQEERAALLVGMRGGHGRQSPRVQFGGLGMAPAMNFAVWSAIARSKAWRLSSAADGWPRRRSEHWRPPVAARLSGRTRPAHLDSRIRKRPSFGGLHHRYARIRFRKL